MPTIIEKIERYTLPVVALHGAVAFPAATVNFELTDDICIRAAETAFENDSPVLVCSVKNYEGESLTPDMLFHVGTVSKIKQLVKTPEGNVRIMTEGYSRATVSKFLSFADYISADVICKTMAMSDEDTVMNEAYTRAILTGTADLCELLPSASADLLNTAASINNPALLADFIASNILVKNADKQSILECFDPIKRIELLIALLEEETDLLECELDIHKRVRSNLNQNQKEYYLREQIRVIQEELGDASENEEYEKRILAAKLPKEVGEKLLKENERMARTPFGSAEATVARSYLDTCLDIPWSSSTRDRANVATAKKILDRDHDGLERVKERILEYLAVKQLNPQLGNQILCLVGPPGVGKTSIAASIAEAMNRKYVRVSLGGVRDEADIRGHRKTYIGAMPGRIINALITAKSNNPLMLLDEIDKVTRDAHGDPASALLEVLDPEQNKYFRDHFVELPFDLSGCVFIATANTLETVPKPLLDRMEVIELGSYMRSEKLAIAKNHLIPKQLSRHGLKKSDLRITDDALLEIIDGYTREAGVRNLERRISEICRKAAKRLVEAESKKKITVKRDDLSEFIKGHRIRGEKIDKSDEVGVVNGLAYTEAGGDVLKVEVAVLDGTGKLELTGSLGDVMKESARIALSYVRSVASEYGIPSDFYEKKDIHIHFPEGAVPKDGPSAGVTMTTAIISALAGIPVKRDIAMTGEVSLRGRVLPIGGLKEKTAAAYGAGVKTVFIPRDNESDLEDIAPEVREGLSFVLCDTVCDVLAGAFAVKSRKNDFSAVSDCSKGKSKTDEYSDLIPDSSRRTGVRISG